MQLCVNPWSHMRPQPDMWRSLLYPAARSNIENEVYKFIVFYKFHVLISYDMLVMFESYLFETKYINLLDIS